MNIVEAKNLACPLDGNKLEHSKSQLICDDRHSFDIARQGYVNLLPVQHKRSKEPGDSKSMVLARTHFLDTGVYEAIADQLVKTVKTHIINDIDYCFLDAGCGEGYYFDVLIKALIAEQYANNNLSFIGLDISKDAIIQATKRNKQVSWVVGTNRQPPVLTSSIDFIICMFGFVSADGFSQSLKPDGKLILVGPGKNHLSELRDVIYSEVKNNAESETNVDIEGFTPLSTENLQFEVDLTSNEQINNLLLMTPHFYRASKEGRERASSLNTLKITVDVVIRVMQKS